ncbi:uncharacterized protein LOC127425374 [Myxocyprinus asiaticus]|uniref:uncharacterized protein LOC127425374 n=1 Tax=Myxocyprinus asiaticus TaxID=70543 RepID=UPI00222268EF|nr:uncharacterized protein LOC127425374 [Myxocyprinus asiaticus]
MAPIGKSSKGHSHCSVPYCSNSKRKRPDLSFHEFPKDAILCRRWVQAIKREEGINFVIKRGSTFVCGQHFQKEDFQQSLTGGIVKRLEFGAIPSRFHWNDFKSKPTRECVFDRVKMERDMCLSTPSHSAMSTSAGDHDYARRPPAAVPLTSTATSCSAHDEKDIPLLTSSSAISSTTTAGALDEAYARIEELKTEILQIRISSENRICELEEQVQHLSQSPLTINRFCVTDEDFRFYTQFPSEKTFTVFWDYIAPSAKNLVYWTQVQRVCEADKTPSPHRSLALIDEFLMYCMRVAAGLKEKVLADLFSVNLSTVSRIIITWANYLYLFLGSIPIWATREHVNSSMPKKYKECCPNLRVILDSTEIKCVNPSSLTLQSETFSQDKNTITLKSLIGIAPNGTITFVSRLYTSCLSDKELTMLSGILDLLEPGDSVMADKSFTIEKMLKEVGASLIVPPFKRRSQFNKEDTLHTHVKKVICRVKQYHIWDTTVPLSLMGTIHQIWANCCFMANYQGPMSVDE